MYIVFIFNRFHYFSCVRLLSFTFGNVSQSTGKFAQINTRSFGFSCNESYLVFYQNTDNFLKQTLELCTFSMSKRIEEM